VEAVIWDMPTVTQSGLCGVERLAIDAQHVNRLDFIFRLRAGLTPSPTNDCKKAAVAPPSRAPSQGEHHDQSR
jgi:hypothetical protein